MPTRTAHRLLSAFSLGYCNADAVCILVGLYQVVVDAPRCGVCAQ